MALVVALGLAGFAVAFGTRHADATEHQDGLMMAISLEAVVKLIAFLSVGTYIVFPAYRAPPPEGATDLTPYPRALLLANQPG